MLILSYLFFAAPYLIAIGFALLLVTLLVLATHSPWVVIALLGTAMVAEVAAIHPLALNFGLWVYPSDAFAGITAGALLFRVLFMGKRKLVPQAWWVFGGVQFALFAWGLAMHGTSAGVDYRPHFSAWAGAAYLATFSQDERFIRRLLLAVQFIAYGMMAVAVFRWVGSAFDPAFARKVDYFVTTGVPFRVLWSPPTFVIGMAMLISIFYAATDRLKGGHWLLAMLFAAFVLVLQHRTVWVAGLGGVGMLAFVLSKARAGVGMKMAAAGVGLVVLVGVMATSLQGVSGSIQAQAERAVSSGGTFAGGRVSSWVALLKDWTGSGSPATYLVGKPFGSGYDRYTSEFAKEAVHNQPHNYYVHLLFRGGLIGLIAFLWVMWHAAAALRRQLAAGDAYAPLLLAILTALLLYYIPYAPSYDHAIFLGLLLGAIMKDRATRGNEVAMPSQTASSTLQTYTKNAGRPGELTRG
jgi:hypothetical protein